MLCLDMGSAMLGGGGHKFQDMGVAVSRYGRGCVGGWGQTFRDIGGAVLGVARIRFFACSAILNL